LDVLQTLMNAEAQVQGGQKKWWMREQQGKKKSSKWVRVSVWDERLEKGGVTKKWADSIGAMFTMVRRNFEGLE